MFEKQRRRIAGPVYPSAVAWTLKFVGEADRKSSVSNRPPVASRRRSMLLLSLSLSFPRGILRRFVFRLFPPFLLFTLLKDPIPSSSSSSLSSSLSWNVHVYIRSEEKGGGAWNRYMEEWKREGELRREREKERERRRFDRWKRHDHDGYEVPRADVVRGYSWERGWPPLRHSSGVRRFEWRPPENKPLVSNLSPYMVPGCWPRLWTLIDYDSFTTG